MKMEAEIGVMCELQAKKHQDSQETTKPRKRQGRSPLPISEGARPCQQLDFRLLVSRMMTQ